MTTPGGSAEANRELLDRLLEKTSRTFALSIPVLPEPTRWEVTVAYLLFRTADTLEDANRWPRARQLEELDRLSQLLQHPSIEAARTLSSRWLEDPPLEHEGYLELLAELPALIGACLRLSDEARTLLTTHTRRTIDGMASFLNRSKEPVVRLRNLGDLQEYCYAVAGIVGEMLTELFLLGRDGLQPIAPLLRRDAAKFGEALQLVNICKDSAFDATEGRRYLPDGIDPLAVLSLARQDLDTARRYCLRLHQARAPRGIVAFTALPTLLAWDTLDLVEKEGAGSKLTRARVLQIVERLDEALDGGDLRALWARVQTRSP